MDRKRFCPVKLTYLFRGPHEQIVPMKSDSPPIECEGCPPIGIRTRIEPGLIVRGGGSSPFADTALTSEETARK